MRIIVNRFVKTVKGHIFTKVLTCYVLILLLLLFSCAITYVHVRSICFDALTETNNLTLENAATNIANAMKMIDSFSTSLYSSNELHTFVSTPYNNETTYRAYILINELPRIYDSNGIVTQYYIYSPVNGYALSRKQGFSSIEKYYQEYFAISESMTCAEWKADVLESNVNTFHADYRNGSVILYSAAFPSKIVGVPSGRVVYSLSAEQLLKLLTVSFSGRAEYAYIETNDSLILCASEGFEPTMQYDKYTNFSCNINNGSLVAHILVPNNVISQQAFERIHTVYNISIWVLILGFILVILTAITNMLPLVHVAQRAEELGGKAHGLWKINEAFDHVEKSRDELQHNLQTQLEYMKSACVRRLIYGGANATYSVEEMLENAKMTISGCRFNGCIIESNSEFSREMQSLELDILTSDSDKLVIISIEDNRTIYAIYTKIDEEEDTIKEFFQILYHKLKNRANIEVRFFIGAECNDLEKLNESFSEAEWLKSTADENTWLHILDSKQQEVPLNAILTETEQTTLKEKILAGDKTCAAELLNEIEERYFVKHNMHGLGLQYIYCRLIEVLVSCAQAVDIPANLPTNLLSLHSKEFFEWLKNRVEHLCDAAQTKNKQRAIMLDDKVMHYIEENYMDYDLTLSSMSIRLKVTSPYLSSLFKKQTGTNFSVYLENVRIQHASEIMQMEDISIDELAKRVGYGNADSFRRAFKRVKGVTPTQFKQDLLQY